MLFYVDGHDPVEICIHDPIVKDEGVAYDCLPYWLNVYKGPHSPKIDSDGKYILTKDGAEWWKMYADEINKVYQMAFDLYLNGNTGAPFYSIVEYIEGRCGTDPNKHAEKMKKALEEFPDVWFNYNKRKMW